MLCELRTYGLYYLKVSSAPLGLCCFWVVQLFQVMMVKLSCKVKKKKLKFGCEMTAHIASKMAKLGYVQDKKIK